jgi:hypothetical protein
MQSGIDGLFTGGLMGAAICNGNDEDYYGFSANQALGISNHATTPCVGRPFCYGQWSTRNADHWLWNGSGLSNNDLFGIGRPTPTLSPTYALGHEMDSWFQGMPLPGLLSGQDAVILGEGLAMRPGEDNNLPKGIQYPSGHPAAPSITTCQEIMNVSAPPKIQLEQAGTILYFPHSGGGHVLTIGASATPWALSSDPDLAGLLQRSLSCFSDGAAPQPPTNVTIGKTNNSVTISWDDMNVNHYEVWHNVDDPYFAPTNACAASTNCAIEVSLSHTTAVSDTTFFAIRSVNSCGVTTTIENSNRAGAFTFTITPGN